MRWPTLALQRLLSSNGGALVLKQTRLLLSSLCALRPVLRRPYGWRWPLALARCALRSRRLVRRTRWADRRDEEARYVRALALWPAVYLDLRGRLAEHTSGSVRELMAALFDVENERIARRARLFEIPDSRERWHVFFDRAILQGFGAFNENECLSVESDRFHFRVFRCVFAELATEVGVPELARMACDLNVAFYGRLLLPHEFHRNGSSRNTLAYGHPYCEYVWERRGATAARAGTEAERIGPGEALEVASSAEKSHGEVRACSHVDVGAAASAAGASAR
jgi:hypothetical protein